MNNEVEIGQCTPDDLDTFVELLDKDNLIPEGSGLSIKDRFPAVFNLENLANIYLAKASGAVLSGVCIRRFNWITPSDVYRGAMLGMLSARPEMAGLVYMIIKAVQLDMEKEKLDFGVLWTESKDYRRMPGWIESDRGISGKTLSKSIFPEVTPFPARTVQEEDIAWVEILRRRWYPRRAGRQQEIYATIPLPGNQLEIISRDTTNHDDRFYVISGRVGDVGVVYEVVGKPSSYPMIWESLSNAYKSLIFHECEGSLFENWLDRNVDITWEQNNQAVWLPLREKLPFKEWYIPCLDRM